MDLTVIGWLVFASLFVGAVVVARPAMVISLAAENRHAILTTHQYRILALYVQARTPSTYFVLIAHQWWPFFAFGVSGMLLKPLHPGFGVAMIIAVGAVTVSTLTLWLITRRRVNYQHLIHNYQNDQRKKTPIFRA